jgi:hypothetical protein
MTNASEIYAHSVSRLSSSERLRLAALILNDLAQTPPPAPPHSALELLESLPSGGLFQTSADADRYLREERDSWER